MIDTKNQYKVDLHTHSIISQDGGITANQYEYLLDQGILDVIAITDHNEIGFARIMQQKLGDRIIVGEEISTAEGEVIGLFLKETIPGGLLLEEAIASIKHQRGIIYIPHPFEMIRKGLQKESLDRIRKDIDIMEVCNGRALFRAKAGIARRYSQQHGISPAASSDAHCVRGAGRTYSIITSVPTVTNLVEQLKDAPLAKHHAPLYTLLCPKINRIRNRLLLANYS